MSDTIQNIEWNAASLRVQAAEIEVETARIRFEAAKAAAEAEAQYWATMSHAADAEHWKASQSR